MNAELLRAAEAATGFMPAAEGLALYDAAARYAGLGPVLEVGSYCGKSTIYLAAAAREAGQLVVTVDHHRGSEEHQPGWEYHDPGLVDPAVGRLDTLPRLRPRWPRPGSRTTWWSWWAAPPTWPGCGGCRSAWCSSTAATPTPPRSPTTRAGRRGSRSGGVLAIHDVFPDPADGGQAPYRIYQRALKSGAFTEIPGEGSLRLLERTGDGIG